MIVFLSSDIFRRRKNSHIYNTNSICKKSAVFTVKIVFFVSLAVPQKQKHPVPLGTQSSEKSDLVNKHCMNEMSSAAQPSPSKQINAVPVLSSQISRPGRNEPNGTNSMYDNVLFTVVDVDKEKEVKNNVEDEDVKNTVNDKVKNDVQEEDVKSNVEEEGVKNHVKNEIKKDVEQEGNLPSPVYEDIMFSDTSVSEVTESAVVSDNVYEEIKHPTDNCETKKHVTILPPSSGNRLEVAPKLERKLSRKLSRKVSRKLTKRVKERHIDETIMKVREFYAEMLEYFLLYMFGIV